MVCSERVIVEYVVTSWTRREPPAGSGTRTQHTSSALPISRAATRAIISCSSCVSSTTNFPSSRLTATNSKVAARRSCWDSDEANSRARGNTEGPINAAPGARLTDGLNEPRNSDIGGQPQPHFQPGTGGPEGQWGLTGGGDSSRGPTT